MTAPSKRNGARPPVRGDAWIMLLVILLAVAVLAGLFWVFFVGFGHTVSRTGDAMVTSVGMPLGSRWASTVNSDLANPGGGRASAASTASVWVMAIGPV
jgi:uncharacterized membrane protein